MLEGLFRFLVFKFWDFGEVAVLVAIVRRRECEPGCYSTKLWGRMIGRLCGVYKAPQRPLFSSSPSDSPQPTTFIIYFLSSFRTVKMSHQNINSFNNTNSLNNTNSFNVSDSYNRVLNNCTVVDDRPQILTWLSPLEPRLRHRGIQDGRIDNVGEWVLETKEFKSWYASSGGSGSDNAVLFCYGGPGVGKTFIRYDTEHAP